MGRSKQQTRMKGGTTFTGPAIVGLVFAGLVATGLAIMGTIVAYVCVKECCCDPLASCARSTYGCLIRKVKKFLQTLQRPPNTVTPEPQDQTPVAVVPGRQSMTRPTNPANASNEIQMPTLTSTETDPLYNFFIDSTYAQLLGMLPLANRSNAIAVKEALRELFPTAGSVDLPSLVNKIYESMQKYTPLLVEQPNGNTALGTLTNTNHPFNQLAEALGITSPEQIQGLNIPDSTTYGGGLIKPKINILGRVRNIVIKDKKKYVKVKGELMLLSEAKKLNKKKTT